MPDNAVESHSQIQLYADERLARYGFSDGHPFGRDRQAAFLRAAEDQGLLDRVQRLGARAGDEFQAKLFHDDDYVDFVAERSRAGTGYLDSGDTPAESGIYEAALDVVGTAVAAADALMHGDCRRAFLPIGGLHHAARDGASGFCVFNDCGVVIEHLKRQYGLQRVAYVDIDAHHGDGVYYGFEDDPALIFADIHEDGRFLFPGTGRAGESGRGAADGAKLNLPLAPGAGDREFFEAWAEVEDFLESWQPEFILLQCGADPLAGDPITHLRYSAAAHYHASLSLARIADRHAQGRLLATGGGGYNRENIGIAWSAVLKALIESGSSR
ncbi:acetoin utilization protein AcuC [Natronospira proteinivora]|uniref:Acetoin utilization protein AcuC n=1 Tax=Natronospira proteinivora TaxID=1807133 RepID=A0ABT1GB68_9GAMM|nr:acetoin utilization protein AcuC [Natronospira proteinivora]MCP1727147.1 acetoin utilization protein AcuC [Natronospira proteinivora]